MDGYLLDTNMVGHYHCGHANVLARIRSLPAEAVLRVSAITLGEIEFGHAVTESTDLARRQDCERFINNEFPRGRVLEVSRHTRIYYGELKAKLFKMYPPQSPRQNHPERCFDRATGAELGIDENDLWIAAQSIEHNLILVTNDEMKRIRLVAGPVLTIEDWTLPI